MGFSNAFRSSKPSSPSTSTTTSTNTSPHSSRTNSSSNLPELSTANTSTTTISSKSTSTSSSSLKLSKTTSSSSFKSLMRTISGKDNMDPMKYAPKKFKFRTADPRHVAILGAWDMSDNWGVSSERKSSWSSGISPCASRRNSMCEGIAEHVEEAY